MKYLGLDMGTKKIGIATSDEGGTLAFPQTVLVVKHLKKAKQYIKDFCLKENVRTIVIGESKNSMGDFNAIENEIKDMEIYLLGEGFSVKRENESFTSFHSREFGTFENGTSKKRQSNMRGKEKNSGLTDDRAAALILQRFLDKQNNTNNNTKNNINNTI